MFDRDWTKFKKSRSKGHTKYLFHRFTLDFIFHGRTYNIIDK